MIEVCVVCYNFQKRLCWHLASIVDQINCPEIIINIAYVKNNGIPKTEDIISFYTGKGLNFKTIEYNSLEELKFRNKARNRQIKESTGDWLLFTDADLIYPKEWFRSMFINLKEYDKLYSSSKLKYIHTDIVDPLLNNNELYISDVYSVCAQLPFFKRRIRHSSVGGCTLISKKHLNETDGKYVSEKLLEHDIPIAATYHRYKCFSDVRFKNVYGKKGYVHIDLPYQFHLGHSDIYTIQK